MQRIKPVQVKTFIPEPSVEAFNEAVLHGFPGIDKYILYMPFICPGI
jgi:hypothetical protein